MKLAPTQVKKIAIFRALQLGDLLCSIPAFRVLRKAYPEAQISLIGLPGMASLIGRFPHYIDEFIAFPGYPGLPEQTFDLTSYSQFLRKMQDRQFDLILQMQGCGSVVNNMLSTFGARYLAGFCERMEDESALMLKYPSFGHEVTRHLALMRHLNVGADSVEAADLLNDVSLEFPVFPSDFEALKQFGVALQGRKYICLHPGSRGNWRQWPPLYFAAIADFCAQQGYHVIITGTSTELAIAEDIAARMKAIPLITAGKTTLGTVAALISHAHALISNCTGVSHIAAALKIQSVVISMDGEPERWGPANKQLHTTIDWTKNTDYQSVLKEVVALFFRL